MPRSHKMLDTMELPPVHRRLFRIILRSQAISFEALCLEASDMPDGFTVTPEAIKNALAEMIDSGLVQSIESASETLYRVSLGQPSSETKDKPAEPENNPGNTESIWDHLDNAPNTPT